MEYKKVKIRKTAGVMTAILLAILLAAACIWMLVKNAKVKEPEGLFVEQRQWRMANQPEGDWEAFQFWSGADEV